MRIHFKKVRYKNILSTGNVFTTIDLDRTQSTLISGGNGAGKCLRGCTEVDVKFLDDETKNKFLEFISKE